jgi:hypothetical protein
MARTGQEDQGMAAYVLYGSEVSLFSGKARAYLRWRGADFEERLATRDVYQNVILPKVGWPVIPVVEMADGALVQDTTDIIETIEARTPDGPRAIPTGPVQQVVSRLLDLFGDEWLVIPAMHYRWNYNEDWIYGEFGRTSAPDAPPAEQYAIGKKNGERFKGAVPMLGVNADTIPGVEAASALSCLCAGRPAVAGRFCAERAALCAPSARPGERTADGKAGPQSGRLCAARAGWWNRWRRSCGRRRRATNAGADPQPADD